MRFSRPFAAGLLLGMAALLTPLFFIKEESENPPPELTPSPTAAAQPSGEGWDSRQTVRVLREGGQIEELTMEDYLWRVVAAEMPASFEEEALRAQAVCARTYCLWQQTGGKHEKDGADLCDQASCCQAYITPEKARERWGDLSEIYTRRIAAAIADTDGQIMTYGGEPIQAAFFSSSGPATEDASQVWGSSLPYLVSVDSPEGEEVPNYRSEVKLTAGEVRSILRDSGVDADLSGDPSTWLGGIERTASGRVAEMRIGRAAVPGPAARAMFGLRSACFEVEEQEGIFTFSVIGYGHGVGMSQYGANAMAREGKSCEEILSHYFTGIELQKRN